ncbi:TonB-dependent receptor plug domain-containing protein [Niveispirillum sp. BGYR6]|uniref:TonB-dependent receptor plug domain-containing protein n=1 Tax=Niveispirillum sp. BGYR6 TaxID=2971249 RepID=UPI0022B99ED2|nr:TonB-dependent receptor plug domain-containing protein [Niveispirillum sp. BGYR6]MDG5497542.1 TonB-dependent receptor plug domain-containing protein [Niveispirillum sp. BGYR6]
MHAAIDTGIARGALDAAIDYLRHHSRAWIEGGVDHITQEPHVIKQIGEFTSAVYAAEILLRNAAEIYDRALAEPADEALTTDAILAVAHARVASDHASLKVGGGLFDLLGASAVQEKFNLDRFWRNARTHTTHDPIRSTDDYVKYAPGITRGGGQGNSAAPTLRGLASEVFQNGQRIYKDGNDHPLNLNAFEGADIVAGPSSVIFGPSNATGGYVNYLTKKPYFDKQRSFVNTELGTWVSGTKETYPDFAITADTGGPIDETLAYRISVKGKRGGTYYDNVENNYDSTYAALSWKPRPGSRGSG